MTMSQFLTHFDQNIKEALNPDTTVSRYGRTWRLSQPIILEDSFFVGKLGFISSGVEKRTYYDEEKKDFIEQPVDSKQVNFTRWVIDLSTHLIAFETKPPDIKYQSFIGALKGILDKRSDIGLTIENIIESAQFFQWVKDIEIVTKFSANLRAPNPNYENRPKFIQELLRDTNADFAKLEVSKEKGSLQTLDTDKTIREVVTYGEEGYATIVAHGLKNGEQKRYDSKRKIPEQRIDIPVSATADKIWHYIIEALRKFKS
jgi:hypothetical protein